MSKLTTAFKKAKDPKRVLRLFLRKTARLWSDETYLRMYYYLSLGKKLNLDNPQTFNEKLQWLKLYDRRPEYTRMVDKYEAKKYVSEILGGGEHIIPTLGVWDKFDDIDFDSLPNQFVLKCTHDSGGLVICKDKSKLDIPAIKKKMEACLERNYYMLYREWPYKNVKPRIIAEKYMEDESGYELKDYKVFNFNGKAKIIQVDYDRFVGHMRNLYSPQWEFIEATINYPNNPEYQIPKPDKIDEMIALAEKLSAGHPFLRTDFYSIEDKLYFGEITFFPESGFMDINPEELGVELGRIIKLPRGGVIVKGDGYILWLHEKMVSKDLKDYKFFCFDGVAKAMFIASERQSKEEETKFDFFDMDFVHLPFTNGHPNSEYEIKRPETFEKMKELAGKLSKGIPNVRVDFYDVNGQVYFGELTLSHWSGMVPFEPEEWDKKFGEWIRLPEPSGGGVIASKGFVLWMHKETDIGLRDYKVHCFNGEPKFTLVCTNRYSDNGLCEDFYDNDWEHLDMRRPEHPNAEEGIKCPQNFELMKELASQLSRGIPFLRVDFYEVEGQVYFGENTFFPSSGMSPFVPDKWDRELGDLIELRKAI